MDAREYQQIKASFLVIFRMHMARLPSAAIDHVQHYLDVAELEMAYESFVLSLIEEKVTISEQEKITLRDLGRALNLHESSVFRHDFWSFAAAAFLWPE